MPFFTGFGLSISLILAIGAQNAFILRQGIARRFVLPLVIFCALSDAALMAIGVWGAEAITERVQGLAPFLKIAGVVFLVGYGLLRFKASLKPSAHPEEALKAQTLKGALLTCAAFTFLNPHVYLDTMLLVGTYSLKYIGASKLLFLAGTASASLVFFFSLGFGARLLSPIFKNPRAWQILDFAMGILMFLLAYWLWNAHI